MTPPEPPRMSLWLRRTLLFTASSAIAVALWHGIPLPVRWLSPWTTPLMADRAASLQVGGAVVSLLPTPRIRLLNLELRNDLNGQPMMRAPWMRLGLATSREDGRWLQLDSLEMRDAEIWISEASGEDSNWSAWPRVPPRKKSDLRLPRITELRNSFIYIKNPSIGSLSAQIDQLQLVLDGSSPSRIGLRLQHQNLSGHAQATALIQTNDKGWTLAQLMSEGKANGGGYPWSLTVALETAASGPQGLRAHALRAYLRRDDDPDTHQAVASAADLTFQQADGRLFIRQGEWTYTHEKAEAWSFDGELDLALGSLELTPVLIPGSEAIPVARQMHRTRCGSGKAASPRWVWADGWFDDGPRLTSGGTSLTCAP